MDESLWRKTLSGIESSVGPHQFQKWLAQLSYQGTTGEDLSLLAPNPFIRDWVSDNYLKTIQDELYRLTKQNWNVAIHLPKNGAAAEGHLPAGSAASVDSRQEEATDSVSKTIITSTPGSRLGLRPNYTFKDYVVGSSNQFAHAASIAVSDAPGGKYNPLFIFGGVGLGKTHLLHAIGHRILDNFPHYRVIYVSSEAFVNELINAIRFEKMHQFREKFRTSCDVLLVDDIQFLAGKERTQEEFFHTFNTLYESGKQIIISSDTFPKDLKSLEERLRSRFEWGLIADIQAPEMETRVAIIKQKAEANGIFISDPVAHYLASLLKSNVRELEGCLIRLGAYASLTGRELDLDLAKDILKNIRSDANRFISIDQVQEQVAHYFEINTTDLKSSKKSKNLTYPRQIAMYLCRKVLNCSYPDIGSKFGGKDHSTVIHAVRKIESLLKHDEKLRHDMEQLQKALNVT